ncbi:class I SAM-dependent methyltransferase [Niveibacterium microcysteis]|nr:methyltransferase domain-containing protein [Niveibacterium microcysteis]
MVAAMLNKDSALQGSGQTIGEPSPWVVAQAGLLPQGRVLDLACGCGRHARWLAAKGWPVLAVDRDSLALDGLADVPGVETLCCDLEGERWPLAGQVFAGVVVTNYLYRPHLPSLAAMLLPGAVLIYETFMLGQARFGRPSNPDFLLAPDELHHWAIECGLDVLAFEQGEQTVPRPACVQRLCARRPSPGTMI